MRNTDWPDSRTEKTETAVIRYSRDRRRFRIETGDSILFDVAAYKIDRELGIAEHIAVERNLSIAQAWPEIIFERSNQ